MRSTKVLGVPVGIGLALLQVLLASVSVVEEPVEELNREHLDLLDLLEGRDVDVRALGDVQENTIQKENVGLNVEMLAPGEAKVEEELRKSLIFDLLLLAICRGLEHRVFKLMRLLLVPHVVLQRVLTLSDLVRALVVNSLQLLVVGLLDIF